jgi:UDP-N-acetylglucosamine 1-carboxyvinyltransferase
VSSLVIKPAGPLAGEVRAGGAKNAVLKQMAACLLATGEHRLTNVPDITDVTVMANLLEALGCTVTRSSPHELAISVPDAKDLRPEAPAQLFAATRSSIVVLGPLLARCGEADMALPGGDDFGQRPINFHTDGLSAMGATFHNDATSIHATIGRRGRLRATRITLAYPSHTATDNLMMACVLAKGRSVIDNAAREPEVEDLAKQLIAMGAKIDGLGTARLNIEGVTTLHGASHEVITDRVVSATYLAAGLISGGTFGCSTRGPITWRCCCESWRRWAARSTRRHGRRRARAGTAQGVQRRDAALSRRGDRLQTADHDDAQRGRG